MFGHMFDRKVKPEMVLNTGDTVMAVNGNTTGKRAAQQIAPLEGGCQKLSRASPNHVWATTMSGMAMSRSMTPKPRKKASN